MIGNCECCEQTNVELVKYIDMMMCNICYAKELELQQQSELESAQRVREANNVTDIHLQYIRDENAALRISTDIFNARIKSINELKIAIDSDESIENKNYKLAEVLNERFQHLSGLLFDKRKEIVEAETEQRAIQTYYNELNKKLRLEEREKIKLADSEYRPSLEFKQERIKKEAKPKKWDKTSVKVWAEKSSWPEQVIQMVCVARDITPEAAVMILNESKK